MNEHADHLEPLSAAGEARRDVMLTSLRGEVVRSAVNRRAKRRALAAAVVLAPALIAGAWVMRSNSSSRTPQSWLQEERAQSDGAAPGWEAVATDPGVAARMVLRSRADWSGVIMGDDELLLELEEMGRPAGLIRMGGKTWVSGLDVTGATPRGS